MCEGKSEARSEVKGEEELRVLQKQEKEKGKKDSAKSGDGCCEPLCSPITCGP